MKEKLLLKLTLVNKPIKEITKYLSVRETTKREQRHSLVSHHNVRFADAFPENVAIDGKYSLIHDFSFYCRLMETNFPDREILDVFFCTLVFK